MALDMRFSPVGRHFWKRCFLKSSNSDSLTNSNAIVRFNSCLEHRIDGNRGLMACTADRWASIIFPDAVSYYDAELKSVRADRQNQQPSQTRS